MAKRHTTEEKERVLSAFRRRTESAGAFAKRIGVSMGSIYRWEQELGDGFREVVPTVDGAVLGALRIKVGEAMVEFDRLWSENPKQDPDTLARQVLKRNSMAPDVSLSRRLPSPKFIVGDRSALDTQKTERNVAAFFMKKHAGDKARVKADPEFRREMQILQEWKADQERQARINAAAKGGTQ